MRTTAFRIDFEARLVTTTAGIIRLTPKEWAVTEYLVRAHGRLVSNAELLEEVWGPAAAGNSHYVRVQLAHLRRKLEPDPSRPVYFVTEPDSGVRFDADAAAARSDQVGSGCR